MPMKMLAKRERTTALRSYVSINSSGTWPIPYGKALVTLTGRGGSGQASTYNGDVLVANGNQYYYVTAYGNPYTVTTPGNSYTVYTPGNPYTTTTPGNSYTVTTPGNAVTNYSGVMQIDYQVYHNNTGEVNYGATYYSSACPSPQTINSPVANSGYYQYTCTPQYTTNYNPTTYNTAYNPDTTTNGTNPPTTNTAYNPTTYSTAYNPDTYASAYNPPNYTPGNNNPTYTGTPMTVGNVTFPGGYGGVATQSNATLYVPYTSSGLAITVPPGGYVNITVST